MKLIGCSFTCPFTSPPAAVVSNKQGKINTYMNNQSYSLDTFVNCAQPYKHFIKYLMEASGGVGNFDSFIHTATPSQKVHSALFRLYQPRNATFVFPYGEWQKQVNALRNVYGIASENEASRWLSAVSALNLVKESEDMAGFRYDKVYLTRPDILLWTRVDLRRYCDDAVYYSNCHPPYFPSRPDGCPSDFHYIMTSETARKIAVHILPHLLKSRQRTDANHAMKNFLRDLLGVEYRTDHVVIARHEEVFRKTQNLMMEADFFKCTTTTKSYQDKSKL